MTNQTVQSKTVPSSCSISIEGHDAHVTFNTFKNSDVCCGATWNTSDMIGTVETSNINVKLNISGPTDSVTISLSGPDDVWFGIGFNATVMLDEPYALIVSNGT